MVVRLKALSLKSLFGIGSSFGCKGYSSMSPTIGATINYDKDGQSWTKSSPLLIKIKYKNTKKGGFCPHSTKK